VALKSLSRTTRRQQITIFPFSQTTLQNFDFGGLSRRTVQFNRTDAQAPEEKILPPNPAIEQQTTFPR
jgi:hypothetical protein